MGYLISQSLEPSAERFPEREAFRHGLDSLSFAQLSAKTDQLAAMLNTLGVKRGDRVGIFLNRGIETAVAVYGILKCGAVFVPIDPASPIARIRFLISDCGIKYMISGHNKEGDLRNVLSDGVKLDAVVGVEGELPARTAGWDEVEQLPVRGPDVTILEDDLAYVMYTSGTTGMPKGIMHTHRSGLNYAKLSAALYNVRPEDRLANHSPLHFDISTMGYLTMPYAGGTTVICPEAHTKFPRDLARLVEDEKITIWYSVPLALTQMLLSGDLENRDLSRLRWVLFGGEPFPIKHLRRLVETLPKATFSNVYGPAEVNQCTYFNFSGTAPDPLPLGRVWDNSEKMIVDEELRPVQEGESGELLVRSGTMMKGYWGQPELTKSSLAEIESESGLKRTFYRTGDLVHESGGNLVFDGRSDRQIKIRGYRVELDEIEAVLYRHPQIEEAAAYVFMEGDTLKVGAAVTAKSGKTLTLEEIRRHLANHMQFKNIVSQMVISGPIPRTRAGKVDHGKLSRSHGASG